MGPNERHQPLAWRFGWWMPRNPHIPRTSRLLVAIVGALGVLCLAATALRACWL